MSDDNNAAPGGDGGISSLLVPGVIRRNLVGKLVLSIVLVLAVTAVIGGFFYIGISEDLEQQVTDRSEQSAELQTELLETEFDERQERLSEVQQTFLLTLDDGELLSTYLEGERDESEFTDIHVVDNQQGVVIGSSNENAIGADYHDRLDPELLTQESFAPTTQYETVDGTAVTAFGQSHVVNETRTIVAEVDVAETIDALPGTSADETAVITSDGGVVLGAPDAPMGIEPTGSTVQTITADDHLYATSPLDDERYVVAVTSEEQAFAVRDSVVQNFGLTLGLAGIVLVVVGIVGGRRVVSDLDRLADRATAMEAGDLDVDLRTGRSDEIGSLYGSFASMRDALREQIQEAEAARTEAEAERERVQQINDDLQHAAEEYCDVMGEAADGNLQVRADVDVEHESMQAIGEDFNDMLSDIDKTVGAVQSFAADVAAESEDVTASSEEVRTASERVAESVQEISDGAKRQNNSLQSVNREMESLSSTTEEIVAAAGTVADTAERTAETSHDGHDEAANALDGMEAVETEANRAVEEINQLESEVEQIDELIDFIAEIAEQTNMLALNANIEASRSSEGDSEGFGVVAQEVKDLSSDTKEAAEEIETRLERIREQTERSATEIQQTSESVSEEAKRIERVADALEEISSYAAQTNDGIQEISAATEQQAASTEEIVAMIDEAATISEETTAEAEHVAAAAEEQTASMAAVTESTESLSERATTLSSALDRFDSSVADDERALPDGTTPDTGDETANDGPQVADTTDRNEIELDDVTVTDPTSDEPADDTTPADEQSAPDETDTAFDLDDSETTVFETEETGEPATDLTENGESTAAGPTDGEAPTFASDDAFELEDDKTEAADDSDAPGDSFNWTDDE